MTLAKRYLFLTLLMAFSIVCSAQDTKPPQDLAFTSAVTFGHGTFVDSNGNTFVPDHAYIERTQSHYIDELLDEARTARTEDLNKRDIDTTRNLIFKYVDDHVIANALFIDWLVERIKPNNEAQLVSINGALRWHYVKNIQRGAKFALGDDDWAKGLGEDIAEFLEEVLGIDIFFQSIEGTKEYVEQCRDAGVPVPDAMYSNEWNVMGTFANEFISEASEAELWLHTSESPQGACLALPRYCGSGDSACLLGMICLGTQTNKSCFFDNPRGKSFAKNVEVGIEQFVGGPGLVANNQGVCSDCHAGENPFIVHPEKTPFAALPPLQPSGWPQPLVDASWPQNPGPTNLLDAHPSEGKCDGCHRVGSGGRFPDVSTALPGYCGTVLRTALGMLDPAKKTMPPYGGDASLYSAHVDALLAGCSAPPTGGGVDVTVDYPDDEGNLSPPTVIDPLYQCAEGVGVRGAMLDAKVTLFVNGAAVDSVIGSNPTLETFSVPPLAAGDVVTAHQELDGVVSAMSADVVVGDHTKDYPAGIPAPEIDPSLIYQCADLVAVRHLPGAKVTVYTNGGDPRSRRGPTGWSTLRPGKTPFDIGDAFTAEAELCGDVSPMSAPESAVAAPANMPAPLFNPEDTYDGQRLVTLEGLINGAHARIEEQSFGPVGEVSTPVSRYPDFNLENAMGGPLMGGDVLIAMQALCEKGPETQTPPAKECNDLPAPRIRHPIVGDTFVVVTEAVPGARIRVYDANDIELGDGSGTVIVLNRALTGADTLTVTQSLDECTSKFGYRVSVRNSNSSKG